ncbi:tyrosine-type recombinase/integrase [Actinomadura sp. NPDC023710]|uniref:tyrosine-type recombinase/integrase n=1 Tax=Actinomadura sp. NPDC023710 TaxID=3158219 RepID=UPI0033E3680D
MRYLRDFVARGNRPGSVRSYAYDLRRWWRFLVAVEVEVEWDKATSREVCDFVLWIQSSSKPRRFARTASARTVGKTNAVTRKRHLSDRYEPTTVRHSNSVLRSFYEFWIETGEGPLVNPVPRDREGRRPNAHHNPLEPYRAERRLRYNPKLPKRKPRSMPDERWRDLFGSMRSNRDRAILALAISTAARANELLGMAGADVDWGNQLIRVRRKGSDAEQWLPASPEAFIWLRLYWNDIGEIGPNAPLWVTLRRRRRGPDSELERRPLNYEALRAVLRRANERLGSNWTMHDARHTCAIRMIRDERLSLRDVQTILGHAHLTTTQIYLEEDEAEVIARVLEHLADGRERATQQITPAQGYQQADLDVLFGGSLGHGH